MSESKSTLRGRADYFVLGLYGALTLLLTYPMPLRLATSARDWGDPFLNAWIMAWQLDKWAGLDLTGYFDGDVFFPHLGTLAYSEFLIPQTIVMAPVYYLSGNALLAHNMALLLSFVTTAFCAYLLVRHVTGSRWGGFVGGLIFAFNPFMFDHLSHLQIIGAAGIPLSLLWLHRYFETDEYRYVGLFTATYVAQALGNAYFAVYLTYAAGAFILYRAFFDGRLRSPRFWMHMAAHAGIAAVLLAPFYLQYVLTSSAMGFTRRMAPVTGTPFLATSAINRLYGPLTVDWSSAEAKLFPGLAAAALALAGILWILAERAPRMVGADRAARVELGYRALGWLALTSFVSVGSILTWGGFHTQIFGVSVSSTRLTNPLLMIAVALLVRAVLRRRNPELAALSRRAFGDEVFYVGLLIVSAVLSLGAAGPYRLLYEYAPGFDAIRAVPRIHIMTMLAAAVLAGIGIQKLRSSSRALARPAVAVAITFIVLLEYVSIPVPLFVLDPPPEVVRWLGDQEGDFAVIFYPIIRQRETLRMYRSLTHGKKIVNGLSGFPAPVFDALSQRGFGTVRMVDDLESLGVRYAIVDQTYYHDRAIAIRQQLRTLEPHLRRVAELGDHLVYELAAPWMTREQVNERFTRRSVEVRRLTRDGWTLSVSENGEEANLAIDGDPLTRWRTRVQQAGMAIAVNIGSPQPIAGVSMALGSWVQDFPGGLRIDVSADGADWRTVWIDIDYELPITEFLRPTNMHVEAHFDTTVARYVRVVIVDPRPGLVWSITELDVLEPAR